MGSSARTSLLQPSMLPLPNTTLKPFRAHVLLTITARYSCNAIDPRVVKHCAGHDAHHPGPAGEGLRALGQRRAAAGSRGVASGAGRRAATAAATAVGGGAHDEPGGGRRRRVKCTSRRAPPHLRAPPHFGARPGRRLSRPKTCRERGTFLLAGTAHQQYFHNLSTLITRVFARPASQLLYKKGIQPPSRIAGLRPRHQNAGACCR